MNEPPFEIKAEACASSLGQCCYMRLQGASSGCREEC